MKMRIFLIRHGQSVANKIWLKQWDGDFELSPEWVEQAEKIKLPNTVKRIYSSNFKRAHETARIVTKWIWNLEVEVDERIREWEIFNEQKNLILTRENRDLINPYFLRYPADVRYWDGESYSDIELRIRSFLNDKINPNIKDGDIAIVSHAGAINHLIYETITGGQGNSEGHYGLIANFMHIKNASITTLVADENQSWKIECFNEISY